MEAAPEPTSDWITQRELADFLGVCVRTASLWAKAGRLQRFEHGVIAGGRRKYSKSLIQRELQGRWDEAVSRPMCPAAAADLEAGQ